VGLVVSTLEPRKNAAFLLEWFQGTTMLPPDAELWWVGPMGWLTSRRQLKRLGYSAGGRRVRFLGVVSDAQLCRLYRHAAWSIYPSLYEGFGFPVLDALRHGTPVLTSNNSSLREFESPGLFFFDPCDTATVDLAWQEYLAAGPVAIPTQPLDRLFSWDRVADILLTQHAAAHANAPPRAVRTEAA
jgi:glycosyltransferase involved in cell wall biosynthesis